jgi:hypothetical protein
VDKWIGGAPGVRLNCAHYEIIRVGVLQFFIAARFVNLAVSLLQYQFASHRYAKHTRVLLPWLPGSSQTGVYDSQDSSGTHHPG